MRQVTTTEAIAAAVAAAPRGSNKPPSCLGDRSRCGEEPIACQQMGDLLHTACHSGRLLVAGHGIAHQYGSIREPIPVPGMVAEQEFL